MNDPFPHTLSRREVLSAAFSLPLIPYFDMPKAIGVSSDHRPPPPLLIFNSETFNAGFSRTVWFRVCVERPWDHPGSFDYIGRGAMGLDFNRDQPHTKKNAQRWLNALLTITDDDASNHAVRIFNEKITGVVPATLVLDLIVTALETGRSGLFKTR